MSDINITDDAISQIVHKQELIYKKALEEMMLNKNVLLNKPKPYQKELLVLGKIIKSNKMQGDKYAVLRDEVLSKSYQVLQIQNRMSVHILRALDLYNLKDFNINMNDEFVKNQLAIQEVDIVDYRSLLQLKENNKILQQAQKNIKDYYALIEINADMLKYYTIFEKRMYRLNKYKNYHILSLALYLDHTQLGEKINPFLYRNNLSIIKIILIFIISLFIYMIRTRLFKLIEILLRKIQYLQKYSHEIMNNIHKQVNLLFMMINLDIVIYIYHNFHDPETVSKFFNIVYTLFFSLILYRILNTVASIMILDIEKSNKKIKSEMVNVSIKIINFLVMIMALLLVMHFLGANLTTVLSGLGIGGFAIAFAARESLSNFLGTISILMSDIFSQGDWIEVDDKEGIVVEIGLRVTTLRNFANGLISIPNGIIANRDIVNWSRRTLGRRIKMSLGIKYGSQPKNISKAVTEIREMLINHPNIATTETSFEHNKRKSTKLVSQEDSLGVKRTLLVYLDELSDSSINILVYCFSKNTNWEKWLETKEDVIYKVMDILEKNNLEFAYPSMSLYHENKEQT